MNTPRIAIGTIVIVLFLVFSALLLPDSILDIEESITYFPDETIYANQTIPTENGDYLNVSGYFYLQQKDPDVVNDTSEVLVFNSTYDLKYRNNVTINETWAFEYQSSIHVSILPSIISEASMNADVGVAEEEDSVTSSTASLLPYMPMILISIFFLALGMIAVKTVGDV